MKRPCRKREDSGITPPVLRLELHFPGASRYTRLTQPRETRVRETHEDAFRFPYSERHLQCIWFDNSLRPKQLTTQSGEVVAIESPGRWNLEAGPDFLDAVLTVGQERRRIKGDVEIHIHPGSWSSHLHGDNTAYARVVAHVSFFPGNLPDHTLPAGTLQLGLRDALASDPTFSFENIDTTSYPYAAIRQEPTPCGERLKSWTPEDRVMLLESAGEERLRLKALRLQNGIRERGEDQILYEEIMAALGYKHNAAAFRQLALSVPLQALREDSGGRPEKAYALLAGIAGLLPAKLSSRWDSETRTFVRQLWDHWWKLQSKWDVHRLPPATWRLSGLRPQNSPLRRMAAAASLFATDRRLAARLRSISTASPDAWHQRTGALFQAGNALPYWNRRLSFSGPPQKSDIAFIGADRIAAIKANVIIPFLATGELTVAKLLNHLPPEHDNNLVRLTAHALFGRDHNPSLYHHGLRQQGLLQIFHDFCLVNRSACRDCPLPRNLINPQE